MPVFLCVVYVRYLCRDSAKTHIFFSVKLLFEKIALRQTESIGYVLCLYCICTLSLFFETKGKIAAWLNAYYCLQIWSLNIASYSSWGLRPTEYTVTRIVEPFHSIGCVTQDHNIYVVDFFRLEYSNIRSGIFLRTKWIFSTHIVNFSDK
jgi:hypothetical protein